MSLRRGIFDMARSLIRKTINVEMMSGPVTYNQDGLLSKHNCDFQTDQKFAVAYAKGVATGSWGNENVQWRAHVVTWAAQNGLRLDGDFVECGVNKGGMATVIHEYTQLHQTSRKFWLLDTYNGLVERQLTEGEKRRGVAHWDYEECFDLVSRRFELFPNVILVRGEVPGTLPQVTADRVAYLGIDMNCTEPEIAAAIFFWDKMSSGAMMVLDDYGWSDHMEQKLAFDKFAHERAVEILSLPTGQGLIVKP
jgi:O-methyltransferase